MQKRVKNNLTVISNRGAYVLAEKQKQVITRRTVSGLVSAVEPVLCHYGGTWIAWCGRLSNSGKGRGFKLGVPQEQPRYQLQEIVLTEEEHDGYYYGFSNSCLWPLSHQMIDKCNFDLDTWQIYKRVNNKFVRAAFEVTKKDDVFWIHDYHLALVPQLLRRRFPAAKIAFFWHIPFPSPDIFEVLPWGREILHGLLGSDIIGFHTSSYVNNFLACVRDCFEVSINTEKGDLLFNNRKIMARALPVGINWERYQLLVNDPKVQKLAEQIRHKIRTERLLVGIDRLDYTKGIPERIKALRILLERYPEYRGKITLLQIGVPSRGGIMAYEKLKNKVEQAVGQINGLYDINYEAIPVRYLQRSLNEKELVAHYLAADVLLVTSLRDGLNLVAKEFIASRVNEQGVLVLSTFAGAAEELEGAVLANPYDPELLSERIRLALEMPLSEQKQRLSILRQTVKNKDLHWWWNSNLDLINLIKRAEIKKRVTVV